MVIKTTGNINSTGEKPSKRCIPFWSGDELSGNPAALVASLQNEPRGSGRVNLACWSGSQKERTGLTVTHGLLLAVAGIVSSAAVASSFRLSSRSVKAAGLRRHWRSGTALRSVPLYSFGEFVVAQNRTAEGGTCQSSGVGGERESVNVRQVVQ